MMLLPTLILAAYLSSFSGEVNGIIPPGITFTELPDIVCPGEPLTLTCETNETGVEVLRWIINLPSGDNTPIRKSIPIEGDLPPEPFTYRNDYGDVVFNFSRTSNDSTYPFITELSISEVNTGINGTEVSCSEMDLSDQHTTIIHILNAYPKIPTIILSETTQTLNETNFAITLKLTPEDGVFYNASVAPPTDHELERISNDTWQLIGSYNTSYNVSVVATLCEMYSTQAIINILEYDTLSCDLLTKQSLGITDPMLMINSTGSRNPARVDDSITFYCLSQTGDLIGYSRITCREGGNWDPDPSEISCAQAYTRCDPPIQPINGYILTNSSTFAMFVCQNETHSPSINATCIKEGVWEPNPRDYCTDIESKEIDGALVGGVLGALIVITVIVTTVVLIFIILFKKGSISLKRQRGLVPKENMYSVPDLSQVENQNSIDPAETLVYADIGPSSLKQRSHVTLICDDDRVEYAQLNQNLLTDKSEKTKPKVEPSSVDNTLNLDTLLIQVKATATSRWYQLGEALGISKETLDRYSSRSPEESIIEMLDQWLRNGPRKPTWRDVADALKKISLEQLASDIENVYETGKLPIEINTNDIPKDPIPPKTIELPPPMLSKMKKNTSDSHLFSQHRPTLPARTKQNSDSRLISYQHEQHKHTGYTKDVVPLRPVQETTLSLAIDSESTPPPLPPKPIATSDSSNDIATS